MGAVGGEYEGRDEGRVLEEEGVVGPFTGRVGGEEEGSKELDGVELRLGEGGGGGGGIGGFGGCFLVELFE